MQGFLSILSTNPLYSILIVPNAMIRPFFLIIFLISAFLVFPSALFANTPDRSEPGFADKTDPLSPYDFDLRNGMGLRLGLNNFGFGIGGEYRRVLSKNRKAFFELNIGTLKDSREQTFQNYWGYSVIPNKYNRVLVFPVRIGLSQRFFAEQLSDNFRLFVQASAGAAPAFVYPYYDHDRHDLGFRPQFNILYQNHYDPFQGWGDGEFIWGTTGSFSVGANIGGDFGAIQSIRIGYSFYYFHQGIQVMEPNTTGEKFSESFQLNKPADQQEPGVIAPYFGKQSFFGTPHITFIFGTMW